MDYTPISAGRVLAAFTLTLVVGLAPVLVVVFDRSPLGLGGGYGGLVLGLGIVAAAAILLGLTWLAVAFGRRVVGRPSRA